MIDPITTTSKYIDVQWDLETCVQFETEVRYTGCIVDASGNRLEMAL